MRSKAIFGILVLLAALTGFNSCKKRGCKTPCASNYDQSAEKDNGSCRACTDPIAINFCPNVPHDDGECLYQRTFWDDYDGTGWIDLWVADVDTFPFVYVYEGRIDSFYKDTVPGCNDPGPTVAVYRRAGTYEIEYENDQGNLSNGFVIFRPEGCRLFEIHY